jgi:ADP-heptose:LPS heptosyltransferase
MARPGRIPIPAAGFRHVAVIRLSSLGDVVLSLPVVHALARRFPAARLTYWVKHEFADVVRSDPAIHHVRALEPEARRLEDLVSMSAELEEADLIVDLHGNARSRILTLRQKAPVLRAPSFRVARAAQVHARWLRRPPPPPALRRYALALASIGLEVAGTPAMTVGDEAERRADVWMAAWGPAARPLALLPGARHFTKRWPEERWVELHDRLTAAGHWLV